MFARLKVCQNRGEKSGSGRGGRLPCCPGYPQPQPGYEHREGQREQGGETSVRPTWLPKVVAQPSSKISQGGLATPRAPSSVDSWLWLQTQAMWQAGHPGDNYLELLHSAFLKEKVGGKERKQHENPQKYFISPSHSTISLCFHFFSFYYLFLVRGVSQMSSVTLLLWSSKAKVSSYFPKKTCWWQSWRFKLNVQTRFQVSTSFSVPADLTWPAAQQENTHPFIQPFVWATGICWASTMCQALSGF